VTLAAIGETGLLELIRRRFSRQRFSGLLLGPGDDAAVLRLKPGHVLVATQDDLAEGAHFETRWTDFRRLAHKLLRINLSDLAAMGAVAPVGVLASAGFSPRTPRRWATEFLEGLAEDAARFNVPVLGGNLCRSEKLFFTLTALGQARPNLVLRRAGAKAGDILAGVGPIGDAARGLVELRRGKRTGRYVKAFWEPESQLRAARILAERKLATSLIDNSDGLKRSCELLARESCLGFRLDLSHLEWAAAEADGEDYGLVFTVAPKDWGRLKRNLPSAYRLGVMTAERCRAERGPSGFDHFRRGSS
jgi:thiamine-monophosphate kinase